MASPRHVRVIAGAFETGEAAMRKLASVFALTSALLATPAAANGIYQIELLIDIYRVLERCAPMDGAYETMRKSVLDELEAEGYAEAQLSEIMSHDTVATSNLAQCAASVRPLIAEYLATPEDPGAERCEGDACGSNADLRAQRR